MVTAELAVGLLVVGLLTVVASWVVNLVVVQTHCGDAASQVARQLARGDRAAADQARGRAPKGASLVVTEQRTSVVVQCSVDERLGRIGPVHLRAGAVADVEPGVAR